LPVRNRAGQLSAQQRESLERDGHLMVPSLLDETVTARMAGRLSELVRQTVAAWAVDPALGIAEPGVVHAKLELADPAFPSCCDHPLLAEAATAVLGPDRYLAALSLRAPLPGCGHQGLHPDFEQAHRGTMADAVGHVVYHRLHPGQRAAAGHPRLTPGKPAADRHAGVRIGNGPAPG
jgi:hypothetical protein